VEIDGLNPPASLLNSVDATPASFFAATREEAISCDNRSRRLVPRSKRGSAMTKANAKSMPATGRNPAGGLTAKGRELYKKTEGAHLNPE
jgi:hypothetical protein